MEDRCGLFWPPCYRTCANPRSGSLLLLNLRPARALRCRNPFPGRPAQVTHGFRCRALAFHFCPPRLLGGGHPCPRGGRETALACCSRLTWTPAPGGVDRFNSRNYLVDAVALGFKFIKNPTDIHAASLEPQW